MSDFRHYGLKPTRLLCPWDSAGKNTGVGCHALLQGIFLSQGSNPQLFCLLHWQAGSLLLAPPGKTKLSPVFLKVLRTLTLAWSWAKSPNTKPKADLVLNILCSWLHTIPKLKSRVVFWVQSGCNCIGCFPS